MEVRKKTESIGNSPGKGKEVQALSDYVGMMQDTINARMGIIIARDLQNFN